MARCRSCKARVEWVVTENGRKMPVDPTPVRDGNIIRTGASVAGLPEIHVLTSRDELDGTETRYVSHFSTCATADLHRR